ncbi:MAG: iron-sulfur cluster repair di-iron protein [Salinivirgaceae bacterium]|nr:iron-sulfur cluster repair di-iron protein [Salinivirgaceae bacterium]
MEQEKYGHQSLADIVTEDFRTASIFKEKGIDFCCGGKKSLQEACAEKSLNVSEVVNEIHALKQTPNYPMQNFKEWDVGFLADYIVNVHHKYVIKTLPQLVFYTQKIASVHSDNHPELIIVEDLFAKINADLLQHLQKEEEALFPAIKEVLSTGSTEAKKIIASEIDRMSDEHEFVGGAMDTINELTNNYAIPDDACNTYKVTLNLLEQFEDDLHTHIHLENNILYPKSLEL